MTHAVGIVAEYNPFHNGHMFHMHEIKKHCPDVPIIVVLSSSFLQRGLPALTDTWHRAKTAVLCGADLVLELPVPFCCHNAGVFASGAVALMKATGLIDTLSFGMESHPELLGIVSHILAQEPQTFKCNLQEFLKKGYSYAEARSQALEILCPGAGQAVASPNNTLAFAYAEASVRQNADLRFLPVLRHGAGYHDIAKGQWMSASGIRQSLAEGDIHSACKALPEASSQMLRSAIETRRICLNLTPLWQALRLILMRSSPEALREYAEIGEGIEHRFLSVWQNCESFDEFVTRTATRRYPRTRIQRQLIHILLGLKHDENRNFQKSGPAYIRPLAMNACGCELLRCMRKTASLPVITRPAALKGNTYAQNLFNLDLRAAMLWESFLPEPLWRHEITSVPFRAD